MSRLPRVLLSLSIFFFSSAVCFAIPESMPMIGAYQVHAKYGFTGAGQTVAIIDTGVDYFNPYINDASGEIGLGHRIIGGIDIADGDDDPMDRSGHGTRMAGIIGSSHPDLMGIAPDVNFIVFKVFKDSGPGGFDYVEQALSYIEFYREEANITTVALSVGDHGNYQQWPEGYDAMESLLGELVNQGVFICSGSGNYYKDHNCEPGLQFPSISGNIVSVGDVWDEYDDEKVTWHGVACDYTHVPDAIVSHAQRGELLDLLAPGAWITSWDLSELTSTKGGVSSAAAHVAGAAVIVRQALLEYYGPDYVVTQDEILSILQATGVPIYDPVIQEPGSGYNTNVTGTGLTYSRIDLSAAVDSIMVPEPASLLLVVPALLGLAAVAVARKKNSLPGNV